MNFRNLMNSYENESNGKDFITRIGNVPVLITAPHTMIQTRDDGTIKLNEPFTKAIALYVAKNTDCYSLVKVVDTGIDANSLEEEEFKSTILKLIDKHNIKLVIDIHGASEERDFDVELGTINNLSADFSTIRELTEAFTENGIKNVVINEPFKGGGITQSVYGNRDSDVIQIEINRRYRNIEEEEKIKKLCESLINFIKQYTNFID